MSEPTGIAAGIADEQLDYQFLLLAHMVCADQQIHSEEAKALHQLAKEANIGEKTLAEMEKILAQEENHLSVEELAKQVPPGGMRTQAMRQILAIAYVDGYFTSLEREMVERIGQIWHWSSRDIQNLLEKAQGFQPQRSNDDAPAELSFAARLLKNEKRSALSRAIINFAAQIGPDSVGQKIEKLEREILLSGPEYDEAIGQCAKVAKEDYRFAEKSLTDTYSALHELGNNLKRALERIQQRTTTQGQANTAKEVAKQLDSSIRALTIELIKELESVRESLKAKQRALNHFSIAFMGKTKAGKSTLHAIVTGEGWNAIGVGKQRTTRLNRVYEWKNIRIIDTPGIGAPGGKSDEEIAKSVIEESDVICYVVTNDSIQETEFQFMKLLKEKAKPLIILLNVKHNIRDSRRLEHFLKDPKKLFAMDGNSSLKGHLDRIHRYAKEHYANDYFEVVPVMLLAAQMSGEPEQDKAKDKLFKASQIQDFLDSLRESLIKYGSIRRSQTLLGSTVGAVETPQSWITKETEVYKTLTDTLKGKRDQIQQDIEKSRKDTTEYLQQQIKAIFQEALNAIPSFAEEHWNANEISMRLGWENKLKSIQFEKRLQNAYQQAGEKFGQEIRETLEEIGKELQAVARLNTGSFSFKQQDSSDFKTLFRLGGGIFMVGANVIALFAPPVAAIVGIIAGVASVMQNFFTSKDQKRREAVEQISSSLSSQLHEQQETTLKQAQGDFNTHCQDVNGNITVYFDELIQGLNNIKLSLETAEKKLLSAKNCLNTAYAKRILDWCSNKYEPLTEVGINQAIAKVNRDFGRSITIEAKTDFRIAKTPEECKQVLQEDIVIKPGYLNFD